MWTPTHILVTVSKGRNLLEKGKGGNDAYCMIGMGKEKFLTSVRSKTTSPVWEEQAEFELTERADLKITVYHKSSIIDEFIGRVVISVADLFNENNKSFVKWYKLQAKEENSKKAHKDRGEIEVQVQFITKPKTGSVMDLSSLSKTNKDKTLSLKNLKDKSHNFKHSFKENFKILGKSKSKTKINEDNQLGEQSKRMNGSKLDFLDGEDMSSLTSSYSSINGNRLTNDAKQMSRYNPSRSSIVSGASSRHDLDSLNDNSTNNDDEINDENNDESQLSFNRNSSFRRSSLRRPSKKSNNKLSPETEQNDQNKLHIAPLPPFSSNDNQRYHVLNSIIHEESTPNLQTNHQNLSPYNPFLNDVKQEEAEPSFANIFTSSFASGLEKLDTDIVKIEPLIIQPEVKQEVKIPEIRISPKEISINSSNVTLTKSELSAKKVDDDEDDHIDWASSDDEEIKQEVETFERNQNLKPIDSLVVDAPNNIQTNKNIKTNQALDNFPATSTFSIDLDPFSSPISSRASSFTNLNKIDSFFDPFLNFKMSEQVVMDENPVNFENDFVPEQSTQEPQEQQEQQEDSESSDSYSYGVQKKTDEQHEAKETDNEKEDDDMDAAFDNFASKLEFKTDEQTDEMSNLANDLAEATRQLDEIIEEQKNDDETQEEEEEVTIETSEETLEQVDEPSKSELVTEEPQTFSRNRILRQSERRRVIPTQDLTSDLNSERDFNTTNNNDSSFVSSYGNVTKSNRSSMRFDFNEKKISKFNDDEIKTPDFDHNYIFQDEQNLKVEQESSLNPRGLPDLINQKEPSDKAKKYLEGLDGVKLDEISVPDSLKKQLEYFDRDELLQLIAYQKKHLDLKESRIKDLENYIDNLLVRIIETDPLILMNTSCAPLKNKHYA